MLWFKIGFYIISGLYIANDFKNRNYGNFIAILISCLAIVLEISENLLINKYAFLFYICYLIAYFTVRPKGELIYCGNCFKKKLIYKEYCPHCFAIDENIANDEMKKIEIR